MGTATVMVKGMTTNLSLTRLFQLISPSLPIGGYTYSQGIEWAVEAGWIENEQDLMNWLKGLMDTNMANLELPVLLRMMDAWSIQDEEGVDYWNAYLLASRETRELREEETNRARAFYQVLQSLMPQSRDFQKTLLQSQHACFSFACVQWGISQQEAAYGLLWSWMENLVLSAVKIIPLGQSAGQKVIFELSEKLPQIVQHAQALSEEEIGASSMALAIASAQHENQYTRLFRS